MCCLTSSVSHWVRSPSAPIASPFRDPTLLGVQPVRVHRPAWHLLGGRRRFCVQRMSDWEERGLFVCHRFAFRAAHIRCQRNNHVHQHESRMVLAEATQTTNHLYAVCSDNDIPRRRLAPPCGQCRHGCRKSRGFVVASSSAITVSISPPAEGCCQASLCSERVRRMPASDWPGSLCLLCKSLQELLRAFDRMKLVNVLAFVFLRGKASFQSHPRLVPDALHVEHRWKGG